MDLHDELLEQAEHLVNLEDPPKQASLRRAVSAAYYALFGLLVSESIETTVQPVARDYVARSFSHEAMKKICKAWATESTKNRLTAGRVTGPVSDELKSVARTFVALQQSRNQADYDYGVTLEKLEAVSKIAEARKAFLDWAAIKGTPEATVFLVALMLERYYKDREID